mmetsp:Transcript_46672/g.107870  ORF Transcript_46672/g.107870 Transcript_46672/m.107870 type:complete len:133 (+) Transcript_46672:36-434(+)
MGALPAPAKAMCTCCVKREMEYQGIPPATSSSLSSSRYQAGTPGLSTGPCIVCQQAPANTVCQPCGHLLVCFRCSLRYAMADGSGTHPDTRCPVCKQSVKNFQRVFTQSPAALSRYSEGSRTASSRTNGLAY